MHLPEAVTDALLRRDGIFGPFLDLALAYENDSIDVLRAKATALGLSEHQLNRAQVEALAFADSVQLN
jgi:EAL and modified HD-GYP domain-containing signal transduction protein